MFARITQPKVFDELIILLVDYGLSMHEYSCRKISKIQEVELFLKDISDELDTYDNKINHSFSLIKFYNKPSVEIDIAPLTSFKAYTNNNSNKSLNIKKSFKEGLSLVKQIADRHLSSQEDVIIPKSVQILLVTDGYGLECDDAFNIIDDLKEQPKIKISSFTIETLDSTFENANKRDALMKSFCSHDYLFVREFSWSSFQRVIEMEYSSVRKI
jgi:hypothetical protein